MLFPIFHSLNRPFCLSRLSFGWHKAIRLTAVIAYFVSVFLLSNATIASANSSYDSYISPFSGGGNYQLHIFGDSISNGVAKALTHSLAASKAKISVFNKTSSRSGFANPNSGNLNKKLASTIGTPIHIAVILVGSKDTKSIYHRRKRYKIIPDSLEWEQIYEKRVNAFLASMKKRRIAVYWVGLPIMREKAFNNTLQLLNDVYRKICYRNHVTFINTWNGFTDQYGNYSPFGSNVEGQITKLRHKDGVHFTSAGYMKLAHYIQREIERDLVLAKEERNIPLAGDPKEQYEATKNSRSQKDKKVPSPKVGQRLARLRELNKKPHSDPSAANTPQRIKKNLAVVAASFGRSILLDISGGLTAISSISSTDRNIIDKKASMRLLPMGKRPYYQVLVKGEEVSVKSGRADDFQWQN